MPQMPVAPRRRRALLAGSVVLVSACLADTSPSPSPVSPSPTPVVSVSPAATPRPDATPTATPSPTPEPPLSLALPDEQDERRIRFTIDVSVPADGSGRITLTVASLADSLIDEIVLRWPTELRDHLFLSPISPRPLGPSDLFVVRWTKWVEGPGERGEPAGTTSLGWGPLEPGVTIDPITIHVTRRTAGPVAFDLQLLAGEAILTTEDGQPAEIRVNVE